LDVEGGQVSDLEQVERLAARQRKAEDAAAAKYAAQSEEKRRRQQTALETLLGQLAKMRSDLRPRLRLYVSPYGPTSRELDGILVALSSAPTWIRKPFAQYRITVLDSCPAEGGNFRVEELDSPRPRRFSANYTPTCMNEVQVLDVFRIAAASFLNAQGKFEFRPPQWYLVVGGVIGLPLAAITWLLCIFLFSWGGVLLGWIPAWLVLKFSVSFWPVAVGGLIWLFQQWQ
jgi:hypothetical protein